MIQPIRVFGDPVLRAETHLVSGPSKALDSLLADMIETMRNARGVGLAAPQVGRSEQVFVVDLAPMMEEMDEEERAQYPPQPMVLINPEILWESSEEVDFEEGCLSIPDVREIVVRPERVRIAYQDRQFANHTLAAGGLLARVIQHEYDHLEGVLFIDHLSSFRRTLLKRRLREMVRGEVEADYAIAVYQNAFSTS